MDLSNGATITSGAGTNSIRYTAPSTGTSLGISVTVTNSSGCKASSGTLKVGVTAQVIPTFTSIPALCVGATAPKLTTESNNEITGTWNPSTISTKSAGTTTYTLPASAGQCATTATVKITVQTCKTDLIATSVVTNHTTIQEEVTGPSATVLPNPSISSFTLQLRSKKLETVEIMVMDLMGHTLSTIPGGMQPVLISLGVILSRECILWKYCTQKEQRR